MADEESPRNKAKRTADRQLIKEDDPEGDGVDGGDGDDPGTFTRAPPEVLRARK